MTLAALANLAGRGDNERRPEQYAAMVQWSMIIVMAGRLARRHHQT